MKKKRGTDALIEYQMDNELTEIPESRPGSITNSWVLHSLAGRYLFFADSGPLAAAAWKTRAASRRKISQQLLQCRIALDRQLEVQATLRVIWQELAPGCLAEDFEATWEELAGPIYQLRSAIDRYVSWSQGMERTLPKVNLQYVLYLMISFFRRVTGDQKRVFSQEISGIINSLAWYLGLALQVNEDTILDAHKRFKARHRRLADRIEAEPFKFIDRQIGSKLSSIRSADPAAF